MPFQLNMSTLQLQPQPPHFFRSLFILLLGALLSPQILAQNAPPAKEVSIACGAVGMEYELCKEASEAWSKKSGVKVKFVSTPNDTNQKLALFQQLLSSQSNDIDLFTIDVIWPGVLHNHFEDLNSYLSPADKAAFFDNLISNNTIQNRWVALPWWVDTGVIYYRSDLLKKYGLNAPETWEDLKAAAEKIQEGERKADPKFVGFVFQGKAYEGLTCNILEWSSSYGGTSFVDAAGNVVVENEANTQALAMAASWVGGISPKGVLNYAEEEARGVFQSGAAAFMRNWPYAWTLLNSKNSTVAGKVGVMAIPKGGSSGKHSPVLGGWHLAVSRYAKNKKEAVELAKFLTSEETQKTRIKHGFFPTLKSLYQDKALMANNPLFSVLAKSLETAVARPSSSTGSQYNRVSNEIWNAGFSIISGKDTPAEGLKQLDRKLKRISRGGKWN
jgi:trehalose/maltose transport system substrate-binding protein